jgi:hypothetical protein
MEDFSGKIYKIVFPNGKHYIGLTTRILDERKKEHNESAKLENPTKKIVHRALKKFNMIDTFQLIEIDNTATSIEELYEKEKFYIEQYNSYYKNKKGYNMTFGGDGNHGYVFTKADRKKLSKAQKKRCENPVIRAKLREQSIQYYSNPDAREQMSQIKKAHYQNNPEAREKASKAQLQRFSNPEEREKTSKAQLQRFANPEAGKEHSQKMKAYFQSNPEAGKENGQKLKLHYQNNPEAREKMSQIKKEHYQNNPQIREKMSQIKKAHFQNNPEAREKMSQITKAHYQNNQEARKCEKNRKLFKVFRKDTMEFIKEFEYQFEAIEHIQKAFDVNVSSNISAVLNKDRNSTQGFVFKYI